MNSFDYLLIAHLLGDFLFQTKWMADKKVTLWLPLIIHSFIYTAIIWLISYYAFGGLSLTGFILIFSGHIILDRRVVVNLWASKIMRMDDSDPVWIKVAIDQIFHIILLAISLHL